MMPGFDEEKLDRTTNRTQAKIARLINSKPDASTEDTITENATFSLIVDLQYTCHTPAWRHGRGSLTK